MKKFQIKPRHIVLALSLLAMLIAFMVYTVCVSGKYSYTENVGAKHLEADQVHAKSSDETVAKIVSVENYTEEGNNELKVTVEGVNPGDCVVTLAYRSPENGQMLVRTSAFRVLPIGVVYDLTIDSFTSLKAVIPLGVAAMLLIVAVLSLSFREKQRNGEFYYSMVIIGGVILFLLLNVGYSCADCEQRQPLCDVFGDSRYHGCCVACRQQYLAGCQGGLPLAKPAGRCDCCAGRRRHTDDPFKR